MLQSFCWWMCMSSRRLISITSERSNLPFSTFGMSCVSSNQFLRLLHIFLSSSWIISYNASANQIISSSPSLSFFRQGEIYIKNDILWGKAGPLVVVQLHYHSKHRLRLARFETTFIGVWMNKWTYKNCYYAGLLLSHGCVVIVA